MKAEPRGKFGGVKVHLEPEECTLLLEFLHDFDDLPPQDADSWDVVAWLQQGDSGTAIATLHRLCIAQRMGKKISQLLQENPDLLQPRTPEQLTAILIKEAEKTKLQLDHHLAGGKLETLSKSKLAEKLLSYLE